MGEINGLPLHVLVVHAVVVLVPVAALAVVLSTWWPRARTRLGIGTLAVAAAALAVIPVATSAGEWLEERVPETSLVEEHTSMGESLLPWVIALVAVAAVVWWLDGASGRRRARGVGPVRLEDRSTHVVLGLLAVVVALGSVVTVYRIGDSGAKASWDGRVAAHATGD
jgi:hypothetical protein